MDQAQKNLDPVSAEAIYSAARTIIERKRLELPEPKPEPSLLPEIEIKQKEIIEQIERQLPDLFKTNWETDDALGDSLNEQLAHHFLKRRRDDLLSRVYEIAGHVSYYPFSYKFERGEVAGEAVMFILRRLEKEPEWVLTYPGEWELSRYVRGICWNVSKLLHRRASRELSLPAGFDVGSPPDPSTIVEISDQVEWLHRIMPSLPPSDQTILFHRLAGHTWEHISRNEEISVNALYQRFHRLMRKLRELAHNDE